MTRYIENRVWFLGAKILTYGEKRQGWLLDLRYRNEAVRGDVTDPFELGSSARLRVAAASLWTDDEEYPDSLLLEFDDDTLSAVKQYLSVESQWPMRDIRMAVHATGFLHLVSEYEVMRLEEEPEVVTERLAESLDRLLPFVRRLVDVIHEAGLIRKSPHFHFGVPVGLESIGRYDVFGSGCSPFDAYSYNQHFVVSSENSSDVESLSERLSLDAEVRDVHGLRFRAGRTVRVWWGSEETLSGQLPKALAVDTLQLSQLVGATTAQTAYAKLLLRVARQEGRLDPDSLRSIMDLSNGIWQHLMLYEWRLAEDEGEILEHLKLRGWNAAALDGFRSAEANLAAATEGQESLVSRQLSRATESVILVLTILSVYSVASDVASFLGNREDLWFPSPPGRIGVILAVTAIVALLLVLIRQRSLRSKDARSR